jgi:hypothetical protein
MPTAHNRCRGYVLSIVENQIAAMVFVHSAASVVSASQGLPPGGTGEIAKTALRGPI